MSATRIAAMLLHAVLGAITALLIVFGAVTAIITNFGYVTFDLPGIGLVHVPAMCFLASGIFLLGIYMFYQANNEKEDVRQSLKDMFGGAFWLTFIITLVLLLPLMPALLLGTY